MSELSLDYFAAIGNNLNISQAAKELHISQQSLSAYLKKLESDYGAQLLVRKPTMQLTEAGKILYDAACRIVRIQKDARSDIDRLDASKPILSIGIYAPNAPMLMDFIPLIEFGRKWPNVAFNVTEASNFELREMLAKGKLDMAITAYTNERQFSEFEIRWLYRNKENIIISDQLFQKCFPDGYPENLQRFRKGVRLEEFKDVPLVMPPPETGFSKQIYSFCKESGLELNVIGEFSNRYLSNSMVQDGLAYGFSDSRYLNYMRQMSAQSGIRQIHAFPLIHPHLSNSVGILYRKKRNASRIFSGHD